MPTRAAPSEEETRPETDGGDLQRVAILTLAGGAVVLGVLAATLVVWHGRTVFLLLVLAYTLAAAIRPGVETLAHVGVPRALGVALHGLVLVGFLALLVWIFIPVALEQTQAAVANLPRGGETSSGGAFESAKEEALTGLERELRNISRPEEALSVVVGTLAALAATAFTLAAAAYWVVERDRLVNLVLALVPRAKRRTVRDTWLLIDLKLGAVIRTKLLLVGMSATILSFAFWVIGLPYFLLVGTFAGLVEVLPVIGPLLAGVAAVAVGFSVSWKLALAAGLVVYGLRIVQDYVINPRLFGRAVHLPPLVVLLAVSALALLLGPLWVPLAIPMTAVLATLVEVLVWKENPAQEEVPTVLSPKTESVETRRRRPWRKAREAMEDARA
jgi:predicted PurR-regulated permease PerM